MARPFVRSEIPTALQPVVQEGAVGGWGGPERVEAYRPGVASATGDGECSERAEGLPAGIACHGYGCQVQSMWGPKMVASSFEIVASTENGSDGFSTVVVL